MAIAGQRVERQPTLPVQIGHGWKLGVRVVIFLLPLLADTEVKMMNSGGTTPQEGKPLGGKIL